MALGLVRPLPAAEPEGHETRQAAVTPRPATRPATPPAGVLPPAPRLPADSQMAS
jgi:hypothetical protein